MQLDLLAPPKYIVAVRFAVTALVVLPAANTCPHQYSADVVASSVHEEFPESTIESHHKSDIWKSPNLLIVVPQLQNAGAVIVFVNASL